MKFPYEQMEVKEQCGVGGITFFMVQTKSGRDGWEVADIRPDIPNQRKVAELLAAAPELLEALEELFADYKALADSGDAGNWALEDITAGKKAMAAIACARGEA